jgi:hypothetical protein
VLEEHLRKPIVQVDQSSRQIRLGIGTDLPVGDMAQPVTLSRDDSPTRTAQARIKADDDQLSRSITSSETS